LVAFQRQGQRLELVGGGKTHFGGEGKDDREHIGQRGEGGPGLQLLAEDFEEEDEEQKDGGEDEAVSDEDVGAERGLDGGDGIEERGVGLHGVDLLTETDEVPVAADEHEDEEGNELQERKEDAFDHFD
jgi:hypothetical protein